MVRRKTTVSISAFLKILKQKIMKKGIHYAAMFLSVIFLFSCEKKDLSTVELNQTKTFSSDVAIKWMDMQLSLIHI